MRKKDQNTKQPVELHLSLLDVTTYTEVPNTEKYVNGKDYVYWGKDNLYPEYLWKVYSNCGILQSVIDGLVDYTMGETIINNTGINEVNQYGDSITDTINKLLFDRWIFGGVALQVKFNKLGQVIGLAWIDIRKCRVDENGKYVFVHDNWNNWGSNRYLKFNAFNHETGKEDGVQIFYYKGSKTRGIYPVPDYSASIPSCEIQMKIKEFHNNELDNNFMSSGIINFNNGKPDPDSRKKIEEGINRKYAGTKNAARMMVTFNEDKDHAATIARLATDNFADRYNSLAQESRADIFISLRAHPQLFGMTIPTGFADIEYKEAFNLLNQAHISKKQKEIERIFAKIFDKPYAIQFKPIELVTENEEGKAVA